MRFLAFILIMYWSGVRGETNTFGPNFRIQAAIHEKNQLILITSDASDGKVFHIQDFKYENQVISMKSVKETKLLTAWQIQVRFLFKLDDYVVVINSQKESGIRRLIAHKMKVKFSSHNYTITEKSPFEVSPYTYEPGKDPWNLMSLLAKFPEDNIEDNLKSIVSFPFNEESVPKRFFVYYLEKPVKDLKKPNKFKRHIMIESEYELNQDNKEINWKHDNKSGNCIPEPVVSDSVVRLNDNYLKSTDSFSFDIMEFYGTNFEIKTVQVTKDKVFQDLHTVLKGSITELLGLTKRSPPSPDDDDDDSPDQSPGLSWIHVVVGILLVCFTIAIITLLYYIISALIRMRKIKHQRDSRRVTGEAKGDKDKGKQKSGADQTKKKSPVVTKTSTTSVQ